MKKSPFMVFAVTVFLAVWIVGCAPVAVPVQPDNLLSPTLIKTPSVSPSLSSTNRNVISPTVFPSLATEVKTQIPTSIFTPDWSKFPSLSQVVLSPDDLPVDSSWIFDWILDGGVTVKDTTNEMGEECLHDCVKVVWFTPDKHITIFLMRAGDSDKADRTLVRLYDELGPPYYEYTDMFINKWEPLLNKGWAIMTEDWSFAAGSRYGPLVILVLADYVPGTDDIPSNMEIAVKILAEQIRKLESLEFPPQ
jgi:hypothetical protein